MNAPLSLRWGPSYFITLAVVLILGLGFFLLKFSAEGAVARTMLGIVALFTLLFAVGCVVIARRLINRQASVLRPMKLVRAGFLGLLIHGALVLILTGVSRATGADQGPVEHANLIFALVEAPVGLILVIVTTLIIRDARKLVIDGVLN
jgi:hypothetical protein